MFFDSLIKITRIKDNFNVMFNMQMYFCKKFCIKDVIVQKHVDKMNVNMNGFLFYYQTIG